MKQIYFLFGIIGVIVAVGALVFSLQPPVQDVATTPVENISPQVTPPAPIETPPTGTSSPIKIPPTKTDATPLLPDATGRVTAKIGDVISLPGALLKILTVVQDSRCPVDVMCIWAGEVQVEVLITEKNTHSTKIIIKSNSEAMTIGGSNVSLIDVSPSKKQGEMSSGAYRFTFQVEISVKKIAPPPSTSTGMMGTVLVGPMCPVMREGVDCPDKPASFIHLGIYDTQGVLVTIITTDGNGSTGIVPLPESVYVVKQIEGNVFPRIPETEVRVVENQITEFTIHGDSGIR